MSRPLSVRLLLALRWDAARACTELARLGSPGAPAPNVLPEEIRVTTRQDGRWCASLRPARPGMIGWRGDDGCLSETDALISLIDATTEEIERRGGVYRDLLERAESDASGVRTYRQLVTEGLRAIGTTMANLDDEGECPLGATTVTALLDAETVASAPSAAEQAAAFGREP